MDAPWATKEDEILKQLKTTKEGLKDSDAKILLQTYGLNKLEKKSQFRVLKIILSQINSPLIYILFGAMVLSYLMHSKIDAYVIFAIIILNTGIGFIQQYRAENAIANLKKFMVPKATVKRNGKMSVIDSEELVPGDIVLIEAGEKISADMRIIEADNLKVNEAVLTGESESVLKSTHLLKANIPTAEKTNMLFAGTKVEAGSGIGVVIATANKTEFGKIASKLQDIDTSQTPIQKRVEKLSKQIGLIIIGLVIVVFILGSLRSHDYVEMFIVAITLAVGAIPEGLPAVMAIAFSISSGMMAKKNVIIRRLPAVESLGSVTVICTDKTGTITQEKIKVQKIISGDKIFQKKQGKIYDEKKIIDPQKNKDLSLLLKTSILSSNARFEKTNKGYEYIGDSTETALIANGLDLGYSRKVLTEEEPREKTFDFDSERKLMSILRKKGKLHTLYTKGAPEKILQISTHELINGSIEKLSPKRKKELRTHIKKFEGDALRMLGFAYKNFTKEKDAKENGLIFLGFMGMMDPPRSEVKDAIAKCKSAGIQVKMITGDSLITAKAVAKEVGITGNAIDSTNLAKLSDKELLEQIEELGIIARATPEQKLRIEKALQEKGHTVAMTGDGVNDVLALKSADVGIAMGIRGTDVARDVSDIILVDDNFASIVNGVEYGRVTYDNIKKFTKYMLGVNFDTIILVTITAIMGLPLPILPLQILWKNIITDSFPAISLIFEKGDDVMNTPPRREKSPLEKTLPFLVAIGVLNLLVCSLVYGYGLMNNLDIDFVRSTVMMVDILFELFFLYTARSTLPIRKIGIFSNKFLNISILIALALQGILMYSSLGVFFTVTPFTLNTWIILTLLGLSGVIIYEGIKEIRLYRREHKSL